MNVFNLKPLIGAKVFLLCLLITSYSYAEITATAQSIANEMTIGYNIGNTMEVPGDPTAWGNEVPTQELITLIKSAGFNTVRIPAAWDSYADPTTHLISTVWMNQIKSVVDLCIKDSLFVILNIHWDGGWLEENINTSAQAQVIKKQGAYWRQIATVFKDYDRHLILAGSNEPGHKVSNPNVDDTFINVLNSYHQTFIDSVRATGGNNATRVLMIQGPKTDIEVTNSKLNTLPTDLVANKLMMEVHFYPYQFTLMEGIEDWGFTAYPAYYWGAENHSSTDLVHNPTWGEEAYVDSVFNLMKVKFGDKGIPVVIGEYGAIKRLSLSGENLQLHLKSRLAYYKYVLASAKARGIKTIIWDTGATDDKNMTILERDRLEIFDYATLNAVREGYGLTPLVDPNASVSYENALKVLYSAKDSSWGQVDLGVNKNDISAYDSILVRAFVNGQTEYDSANATQYGFVNLNLVTMSNNYTWREASLGDLSFDMWKTYSIPLSKIVNTTGALVPADPTALQFFGLQGYSHGYNGTIYVDYIVFVDNEGSRDTLYTFDTFAPTTFGGNVISSKLIPVKDVASDQEWKTATKAYNADSITANLKFSILKEFKVRAFENQIQVHFNSVKNATFSVLLLSLDGKVLTRKMINAFIGDNEIQIDRQGLGIQYLIVEGSDFYQSIPIRIEP